MYRLSPNSWQPARLRWFDHAMMMVALIVIAFNRGFDYAIGDDTWSAKDFMLSLAPDWVWGYVGFVLGALILSFGVTTRRHLLVFIGHGWLGAAYGVNALALAMAPGPETGWSLAIIVPAAVTVLLIAVLVHVVAQTHATVAFGIIVAAALAAALSMYFLAPFNGVRAAGSVGLISVIHWIHMVRTGGRPLRVEVSESHEEIVDGGRD